MRQRTEIQEPKGISHPLPHTALGMCLARLTVPVFDTDLLLPALLPLMCLMLLADSPQIVHLTPPPTFISVLPGAGECALAMFMLPCIQY